MNKILMVLTVAVLLFAPRVEAMTIDPGFTDTAIYDGWSGWHSTGTNPVGTSFWQGDGAAARFTLDNEISIESILYNGFKFDDEPRVIEQTTFDFIFYNESVFYHNNPTLIPDSTSEIYRLQTSFLEGSTQHQADVNLTLKPGSYWLAAEHGTPYSFVSPSSARFTLAHTPEPATWAMLILGSVGAIFARRRRGAGSY